MTSLLEQKINEYIADEQIMEFETIEDARQYFNIYDYQNFKTVEELKEYQDEFGFGMNGKWYHIDYLDVLDDLKKLGYTTWRETHK